MYWSSESKISKSLTEEGVFEITDRVGHYRELRVEPMVDEVVTFENDYKSIRLNGQDLALLYMALSKNLFHRPKKGQMRYKSYNDGNCTLYFKRDSSIVMAFYQGKLGQSNAESDWNYLKERIGNAEISDRDAINDLEFYSIYD